MVGLGVAAAVVVVAVKAKFFQLKVEFFRFKNCMPIAFSAANLLPEFLHDLLVCRPLLLHPVLFLPAGLQQPRLVLGERGHALPGLDEEVLRRTLLGL